jgi:hypothetical protein
MLVGSSQSPLSVSDFRNDIFGPYDDEIFLFFSFAFLSIFVCATSGTNVNDIRRIDFKNFRYPWDEPDESDKTTWRWTQLSLQSKVLLIVLAKEHGVQIMTTPRTVSIPLLTPPRGMSMLTSRTDSYLLPRRIVDAIHHRTYALSGQS